MEKALIEKIKDAIIRNKFKTQNEIVSFLKSNNTAANQSSVSRVLHKIGAIKRLDENGHIVYQIPFSIIAKNFGPNLGIKPFIKSITCNETLVIIKTEDGWASAVCEVIDRLGLVSLLGTIAGENTIFLTPTKLKHVTELKEQIINKVL